MLKDIRWSDDLYYQTDSSAEPLEFFSSAFEHSKSLDLLLGYFSFTAIQTLSFGFAHFLANGGKMRVVANHILSKRDKNIMIGAESEGFEESLIDLTNIPATKKKLDDKGTHFFNCIAYLIRTNRIEFILIEPKRKKGIAHYKQGIFSDGTNQVFFHGSCNFTAYGLLENLEHLDVTLDWEDSRAKVAKQQSRFEHYFNQSDQNVNYIDIQDAQLAIEREFKDKEIYELLEDEMHLNRIHSQSSQNTRIKRLLEIQELRIKKILETPKFPFTDGPRKYQEAAYENWIKNGKKGIFSMATGTGKTLTALYCLLREYQERGKYEAVIVVPTIPLAQQWEEECKKFNFQQIIPVNSKSKWEKEMGIFNTSRKFSTSSAIIIVTYASFTGAKFQAHFKQLSRETLFIADEAHNLGAGKPSTLLPLLHIQNRIGLSATIKRQYDDIGNQAIEAFFNDRAPFVIEFPMSEALDKGWLCRYDYFPHVIELNNDELEEYKEISLALIPFFDQTTGKYKDNQFVKMKLLARKRIIHKAHNKLPKFKQIMKAEFQKKGSLAYTLVYAPEGKEPNYNQVDHSLPEQTDIRLMDLYTRAISQIDESIFVRKFTSESKERESILDQFRNGQTHVLTSMKCLDEGVDIPRSEVAIFCASTGNPRQFIQRRGRVLRLHKEKTKATIHDLVVVPKIEEDSESFNMERNIFQKELERVVDFAALATNKSDSYTRLQEALNHYKLNLNDI